MAKLKLTCGRSTDTKNQHMPFTNLRSVKYQKMETDSLKARKRPVTSLAFMQTLHIMTIGDKVTPEGRVMLKDWRHYSCRRRIVRLYTRQRRLALHE